MAIVFESGINVGPGIDIGDGSGPTPGLTPVLSLDAGNPASYPGSGATWTDTIGSMPFTLVNSPTYNSANGGYIQFNPGSGQYGYSTTNLGTLANWSIEAWHYYDGTNTSAGPNIFTEWQYGGGTINLGLGCGNSGNDTDLQAWWYGAGFHATPSYSLTPGAWYQIVGTFDGDTLKLYVNNTLVQTATGQGPGGAANPAIGYGLMTRWDPGGLWGGKLAIVNIYDSDIGQAGVTTSWNANKARFGLGPNPGVSNVVGYSEMNPPVIPGNQLEDSSATINGSTGFTINDDTSTGIAIPGLTSSNVTWFAANYTVVPGFYNVTWGPGSTVASSSIQVVTVPSSWPGGPLVFFVQGQSGAATYNYPFTFSV